MKKLGVYQESVIACTCFTVGMEFGYFLQDVKMDVWWVSGQLEIVMLRRMVFWLSNVYGAIL